MSIRFKLIGAFTFSSLLMLVLGGFALWQLSTISRSADNLANQALPIVETTADIQDTVVAYRLAQNRLVGQFIMQRNRAELQEQEARMDKLISQLRSLEPDAATSTSLTTFARQWRAFTNRVNNELRDTRINRAALDALEDDYRALLNAGEALRRASRQQTADARTGVVQAYDTARSVTIALLAIAVMFSAVVGFSMALDLADDLRSLTTATEQIAAGDLSRPLSVTGDDELGRLADAFRHMTESLSRKEGEVQAQQAQLVARADEITQAYSELQASMQEREALSATVRALATPLIPIQAGVIIAPLVGVFDTERVQHFTQTLLAEVERTRIHTVLVDVTGMALIDHAVATRLVATATAARMLGARTILVGIRPEVAQTLTGLGLSLDGLITRADLQSGVAYALQTSAR
jgi:rsbT co-antagonist protein RsbR